MAADHSLIDLSICASAGGFLSSLLTTPLDVLKVRQQQTSSVRSLGPVTQAVTLVRREGLSTLWSGLRPALGITVPATMIYMSAYEKLREGLSLTLSAEASPAVALVAGGLARMMSGIVTAPMELMRTRAQGSASTSNDVLALARSDGLLALWRGASASLARDVPFSCLYWTTYEALKSRSTRVEHSPITSSMAAAAAAAAVAAVPTTQMDIVKTRTQVLEAPTLTIGQVLRDLYVHEGPRALFAGVVPRVAKVAPSCAIIVGAYELGKEQCARSRRAWQSQR